MHRIEYFDDFDGLLINIEGEPSMEELLQIIEKIAAFNPSRTNIDAIYDLSELDASMVTSDFLKSFVYQIPPETVEKRTGASVAYVAQDALTFGMTMVHQALITNLPINTSVFHTVDEAKDWIISNKN
jgi:hypothetical protein